MESICEKDKAMWHGLYEPYRNAKRLTKEEEVKYILSGNREKLILGFVSFVIKHARKYAKLISYRYFEDFIQEGIVGLINAVDYYKYESGYRLSTYAEVGVKNAICKYISNKIRTVKIPTHITEKMKQAKKIIEKDILEDTNSDDQKNKSLNHAIQLLKSGCTLEDTNNSDPSYCKYSYTKVEYNRNKIDKQIIAKQILSSLNKREKEVYILKYAYEYRNFEIGHMLNVSRQAIHQSLNNIIKKIEKKKQDIEFADTIKLISNNIDLE